MSQTTLFTRYVKACNLQQSVEPDKVADALRAFFRELGISVTVREIGSLEAARAARAAEAAWAAVAAEAAGAAVAAVAARATRAAEAARATRAAVAARAAEAAWAAVAAVAARAAGAARAARAAWDASYMPCIAIGAEELHDAEEVSKWQWWLEAFEAGCWMVFPIDTEVLWLRLPRLSRDRQNRPHAEGKPAVILPNEAWHFLWGVLVEPWMAETPSEQLDIQKVLAVKNVEQRTVLIKRIGVERFIQKAEVKTIDTWKDYTLLEVNLNQRPCRYLKMRNPSVGIWHVEGVPNECRTVAEALHSRKPTALAQIPIDDVTGADWYEQGDVCIWPRGARTIKREPVVLT